MNRSIVNGYFDWLMKFVCTGDYDTYYSYERLLLYLFDREFTWIDPMDENRAYDGLYLRDAYLDRCVDNGYFDEHDELQRIYEDKPCSILEMMVGLAYRCENSIMQNDSYGDRTGLWFWNMIENLGLMDCTNSKYNEHYIRSTIDVFLDRTYEPNGKGGLFVVNDKMYDLRTMEIWNQMQLYLNDILDGEGE